MGFNASSLIAPAAFLLATALTIFTLFFAVAFTIEKRGWYYQVGIAAAAVDVLDLACLAVWFLSRSYTPHTRSRTAQLVAVVFAFIASHALSLVLFVWMQRHPSILSTTAFGQQTHSLLLAAWALCGGSLLAQTLLITLWSIRKPQRAVEQLPESRYMLARISESWAPPSPGIAVSPYLSHSNAFAQSQAISTYSTDSGVHFKSSNATGFWPATSRTRLALSTKASDTQLSQGTSTTDLGPMASETNVPTDYGSNPMPSPSFGYETSPIAARPTTPVKRQLEPIPGSQPNSPGKPLDGPFDEPCGVEGENNPDKGTASSSQDPSSRETERGRTASRIPPRFRKDNVASHSQPTSPVLDESHIHPLFRTDSPLPAPTPTLGSMIIASAFGGQYMDSRSLSRPNARSGQNSPELQSLTGTRRRAGSHGALANNADNQNAIKRTKSMGAVKTKPAMLEEDENIPPVPSDAQSRASGEQGSFDGMDHRTGIAI